MTKMGIDCSGCSACAQVCPVQAIQMVCDAKGFLRPTVNDQACIRCVRCEMVCPALNTLPNERTIRAFYLAHKDKDVLSSSSSGGAFYAIAQWILSREGVVFGAAFDFAARKLVYRSTDDVPLTELMRSKYVECYVDNAFERVCEQLKRGRWVAFCGTPCHVAGLKYYLGKAYERLVLIDFTCGGVPAQACLFDHLEHLEKRYRSRVKAVNFRDKRYGWKRYCMTVSFENGKEYRRIAELEPYLWTFLHTRVTKRSDCVTCKFQAQHCADFVIADFWKVNSFPDVSLEENKGLSLVLCQTRQAQRIISDLEGVNVGELLDIEAARYNIQNIHLNERQRIQLESDRAFLEKHGLYRYYRKRMGLGRIAKYIVKMMMLEGQRRGKN